MRSSLCLSPSSIDGWDQCAGAQPNLLVKWQERKAAVLQQTGYRHQRRDQLVCKRYTVIQAPDRPCSEKHRTSQGRRPDQGAQCLMMVLLLASAKCLSLKRNQWKKGQIVVGQGTRCICCSNPVGNYGTRVACNPSDLILEERLVITLMTGPGMTEDDGGRTCSSGKVTSSSGHR